MNIFIQTDQILQFTFAEDGRGEDQEVIILPAIAALEAVCERLKSGYDRPDSADAARMQTLIAEIKINLLKRGHIKCVTL